MGGKIKKEFLIALLTGCTAATVYADQPRDIRNSYRDLSKTARASQYTVIKPIYILQSKCRNVKQEMSKKSYFFRIYLP